jgi:hypothetical protein
VQDDPTERRAVAVRLLLSAIGALLVGLVVAGLAPSELDVETDIVGFPTFANFNIDFYFWMYGLVALVPLAMVALYAVLTRAFAGRSAAWRPLPAPRSNIEPVPVPTGWRVPTVAVGRTLFVGGVLGLEAAIWVGEASDIVLAACLAYSASVLAVSWLVRRVLRRGWVESASVVNTLATPFLVAGLWGVSRSTEVTITATGVEHGYPWFPAWLALAVAGALFVVLAREVRRRSRAGLGSLERLSILLIAAPVAMFILTAQLPGELGTFDAYEEGQALVGAAFVQDGAFPWRDILISHGPFQDVGRGLLGFEVFEDSRWGLVAADDVLLGPLTWVGVYYLCAYLVGTNWLVLAGTQLVVLTDIVTASSIRMLFVPAAVLLLAALLHRATTARAVGFTATAVALAIATPEALVVAAGLAFTLVAFEFAYRERGRRLAENYPRTTRCVGSLAVLAVGWSTFLLLFGALDDWAWSFVSTIPGHRLTGGIESLVSKTSLEVLAPVVVTPIVVGIVAARVRLRRPLAYQDWLMIAMALYSFVYFTKFLSRADYGHLQQSLAMALPLIFYCAFRGLTAGESWLARFGHRLRWLPSRHMLTLPLLVLLVLAAPKPLFDVPRAAPGHFRAEASREPEVSRIGYARAGENDAEVLRGLERGLAALLEPGEQVFDFSNAPGVIHYLLDEPLATPYYHVSYAIRQRTQSDLLRRLRENPPGAAVLTSAGGGPQGFNSLPSWDGIVNQVRHYDVSRYLHDHYVPVRDVGGFVLMARRERTAREADQLYFREDCDWGLVPDFFAPAPTPTAASAGLSVEPVGQSRTGRFEYAVTIPSDAGRYAWLEIVADQPLEEGSFQLSDRRELALESPRAISFQTRGGGGTSIRVNVGACSQWHGYRAGTLYLSTTRDVGIRGVRLVERAGSAS